MREDSKSYPGRHRKAAAGRYGARLALALAAILLGSATQAVEVGEMAPDFSLPGSDGQIHTLSELRGQHVVIAFFPKAFTGG
jgi:peroxiredoxin Q/BCP